MDYIHHITYFQQVSQATWATPGTLPRLRDPGLTTT